MWNPSLTRQSAPQPGRTQTETKETEMSKHNHSNKPNFKRVHNRSNSYLAYQPGVRGCRVCQEAANVKNQSLAQAAQDNFTRKNRLA